MKKIMLIVIAVVLSACATYGQPITQEQIDGIKTGVTTRSDLLATFGKPVVRSQSSDGSEILGWSYAHVGFAGSNYKNQAISVVIGPDGKVTSYTTSDVGDPRQ